MCSIALILGRQSKDLLISERPASLDYVKLWAGTAEGAGRQISSAGFGVTQTLRSSSVEIESYAGFCIPYYGGKGGPPLSFTRLCSRGWLKCTGGDTYA